MRIKGLIVGTMLAMTVTAAPALAEGQDNQDGQRGRALGRYCQDQSKKHVPGTRGTPFSRCVTAMAKLAHGTETSPRVACKDMSKRHVDGQRGTPFSRCVSAGARLLEDKADDAGTPSADGKPRHGRPTA
jgi:hypothetical protein